MSAHSGIEKMYFNGDGKLIVEYNSQLLKDYAPLFEKILQNKIKEANYSMKSDTKTIISIPSSFNDFSDNPKLKAEDTEQIHLVFETLDQFEEEAMTKRTESFEIIPLEGYGVEGVISDIKKAVHAKRNLCIIDTYDNYLLYNKGKIFEIKHINVDYLSDDYCNAVVCCVNGDMQGLRELFENRLEMKEWF